ncbi:MAG: TetR-like C-terminal domain-containing protein, partial [Gemmatimonadota bacterium]
RIEYSPATIYLYFKDKDELIREVVQQGMDRMSRAAQAEVFAAGPEASALEQYAAMGRAYARFAIDNPAYFRVMFELPATAEFECPEPEEDGAGNGDGFANVVAAIERAMAEGSVAPGDAHRTALIGWGLIHGLTSLYLAGHLRDSVTDHEAFMTLVDDAMRSVHGGWEQPA